MSKHQSTYTLIKHRSASFIHSYYYIFSNVAAFSKVNGICCTCLEVETSVYLHLAQDRLHLSCITTAEYLSIPSVVSSGNILQTETKRSLLLADQ